MRHFALARLLLVLAGGCLLDVPGDPHALNGHLSFQP